MIGLWRIVEDAGTRSNDRALILAQTIRQAQAWGLKKTMTPFFGTPYYDQPYRMIGSKISCYLWYLADPIVSMLVA